MRQTRLWSRGSLLARHFAVGRFAMVGVAAVLLTALLAQQAAAQVLDQIPSDAMVVVKVRNLKQTSDKIGKFTTDLGVAQMAPQFGDPLKTLQDQANVHQGLNAAGDLFFVFVDPSSTGGPPDKSMLILIPVSDYKAFLGNFADAQTEGEVSQVKLPQDEEPAFFANWGTYAAMSPSKELVGKKPTGLKLTAATAKELDSKDIVAFANFAQMRATLKPQLDKNREEFLAKAEDGIKRNPQTAKFAPVLHVVLNSMIDAADTFLRDTEAATFGLTIADEGLKTTVMADFKSGSQVGGHVAAFKNTNEPLITGLPPGKYLFYGGSVQDPAEASKLISELFDPMVKQITDLGPEYAPIGDYMAAIKAYVACNQGSTIGVLAPSGNLGQEALFQTVTLQKGDAAGMLAAQQKAVGAMPEIFKAFGMPAEAMKMTITPKAKTIDGVTFDAVTTAVAADPNNPMAARQQQMNAMIFGPNGMKQLQGVVGDKLLVVSGLNDATVSSAIAAAKSNDTSVVNMDQVKKVADNLPKSRMSEMYIPVDDIVTTGLTYAKQLGFAVPVQLPPDLPPVGMTLSTEGSTVKIDSYVPTPLVQSLVAAGLQAAMQMQGGGGGGGGL